MKARQFGLPLICSLSSILSGSHALRDSGVMPNAKLRSLPVCPADTNCFIPASQASTARLFSLGGKKETLQSSGNMDPDRLTRLVAFQMNSPTVLAFRQRQKSKGRCRCGLEFSKSCTSMCHPWSSVSATCNHDQ